MRCRGTMVCSRNRLSVETRELESRLARGAVCGAGGWTRGQRPSGANRERGSPCVACRAGHPRTRLVTFMDGGGASRCGRHFSEPLPGPAV